MPIVHPQPLTPDAIRERVAKRVAEIGVARAALEFDLARETILRCVAGLECQRGTYAQFREYFATKGEF
jgi:hypothetical protein